MINSATSEGQWWQIARKRNVAAHAQQLTADARLLSSGCQLRVGGRAGGVRCRCRGRRTHGADWGEHRGDRDTHGCSRSCVCRWGSPFIAALPVRAHAHTQAAPRVTVRLWFFLPSSSHAAHLRVSWRATHSPTITTRHSPRPRASSSSLLHQRSRVRCPQHTSDSPPHLTATQSPSPSR